MSIFTSLFRRKEISTTTVETAPFDNFNSIFGDSDDRELLSSFVLWTQRAITLRADSMIINTPKLIDENGEEVDPAKDQMLSDLIHFNAEMSWSEARRLTHIHLDLTGTAYWHITLADKIRSKSNRFDFFILQPDQIKEQYDNYGMVSGYIHTSMSGKQTELPKDTVIGFKRRSPENWQKGLSLLKSARYAHDAILEAYKYNLNVFGNIGRPDGIINLKNATPEQVKQFQVLLSQYRGTRNGRKMAVMNQDFEWTDTSRGNKEVEFVEGMKLLRDDILSFYGVPKPLVGLTDSTFNNASEAQRIFQQYTVLPELLAEIDTYNIQLLPKYTQGLGIAKRQYKFVVNDPVTKNAKEDAEVSDRLYRAGIIKLNEARKINGLEEITEGDKFSPQQQPATIATTNEPVAPQKEFKLEKKEEMQKEVKISNREELKSFLQEKALEKENRLLGVVKTYLKDQYKRYIKSMQGKKTILSSSDQPEFDLVSENKLGVLQFTPVMERNATEFWMMANSIADTPGKPINADIIKRVRQSVSYFVNEVNTTTQKELEKLFQASLAEDYTLEEYSAQLKDIFARWSENELTQTRAETIAITENTRLKNSIYRDNYFSNDFVEKVEWLTAGDSFVRGNNPKDRFDHASMDGVQVSKGIKFYVSGEYLTAPGDSAGSAGNVINCRCDIAPVVK